MTNYIIIIYNLPKYYKITFNIENDIEICYKKRNE